MYNLYYWAYSPQLMCTFSDYSVCKEALTKLKEKYPTANIWMKPVSTINSIEEWQDIFKGEIEEYANLNTRN